MLREKFRPWGLLPWVLDHVPSSQWSLLGAVSTEDRCLAAWQVLSNRGALGKHLLLEILDEPSRFSNAIRERLQNRRADFSSGGAVAGEIQKHDLFAREHNIIQAARHFADNAGANVLLDVSTLPKRFFFPIIRVLLRNADVRNLIATYTIPKRYTHEPLAEDPEPWRHLPTFMPPFPEPKEKLLIVGLGYEPLGLPQLLMGEDFQGIPVRVLFPFPSLPPGVQRNWDFIRQFQPSSSEMESNPTRVYIYDVPETFDRILRLTDGGTRYAILAPYGPKPMSLAMCLYAVSEHTQQTPPAIYYTQPKIYNPDYSTGVRETHGAPTIYAYCLRLNGTSLY